MVSKFWDFKNESRRLRWGASSSTISRVGRALDDTTGSDRSEFDVRDAEDRTAGFVGEACDFPAMSQHDLLHHRKAESSSLLMRGEVRLEDFLAMFGGDARAVVADFDHGAAAVFAIPRDFDLAA